MTHTHYQNGKKLGRATFTAICDRNVNEKQTSRNPTCPACLAKMGKMLAQNLISLREINQTACPPNMIEQIEEQNELFITV